MTNDKLTLCDGREIRILWNMNALAEFTELTGKEITDLEKPDVNLLRTIAWCAAKEGEAADGKEFELDMIQLGRLLDMKTIVKFSEILTIQSTGVAQKKSEHPKRLKRILFRMGLLTSR